MDSAFEHISFLARSSNRVDALTRLSSSPATHRELVAVMDASRVTVSRVLGDLTDRRWVVEEAGTYRATPTGELVAREFQRLCDAVSVGERLRDVVEWFPREWATFDLRRLEDAKVTVPTTTEPTAPVRVAVEWMSEVGRVRLVAQSVVTEVLRVQRDRSQSAGLTAEVVLSDPLFETIVGREHLAERVGEMVETGSLDAYHYPDAIRGTFGVFDGERVGFAFVDEAGRPSAAVTTGDDAIREWAEATADDYRARATRLSAGDFGR